MEKDMKVNSPMGFIMELERKQCLMDKAWNYSILKEDNKEKEDTSKQMD
jgi:hypothetical protein